MGDGPLGVAVQRDQAEVDRLWAAIQVAEGARRQAELDLGSVEEPLRRARVAELALPDLTDALDAITGIGRLSQGHDVQSLDELVRTFDQATEQAAAGELEAAQAAVDAILQAAPQVAGEAVAAANAAADERRGAAAETAFRNSAGGEFADGRQLAEVLNWLEGGRRVQASGEITEDELAALARERFIPGLGLGTDPVLNSRAGIGVNDLRSGGTELTRLLSGDDSASKLERVNEQQLETQQKMLAALENQGLALAE